MEIYQLVISSALGCRLYRIHCVQLHGANGSIFCRFLFYFSFIALYCSTRTQLALFSGSVEGLLPQTMCLIILWRENENAIAIYCNHHSIDLKSFNSHLSPFYLIINIVFFFVRVAANGTNSK